MAEYVLTNPRKHGRMMRQELRQGGPSGPRVIIMHRPDKSVLLDYVNGHPLKGTYRLIDSKTVTPDMDWRTVAGEMLGGTNG